jgi:hypothetical protein
VTGSAMLQNMHEPFALRYTRTLCDAFEDPMYLFTRECSPLLRSEQGSAAVITSNLDPSPDRFDRKVNGRSIQAAALGYISNLSRITYLLSKRNLEIFDSFVNQSSTSGPTMHTPKACAGEGQGMVFSGSEGDSFRLRVPSTSQDPVPWRSRLLTLSTAQSFSTHNPDF